MNRHRTTLILAGLFLAGLLGLWGLERAGVPTEAERRQRSTRVIPELIDVPDREISRIEIIRGEASFRFDRRRDGSWQMTRPLDVAADATIVDRLAANLKELRPSDDAGTVLGTAAEYGFDPPRATVRIWKGGAEVPVEAAPLASLELGKILRDQTFVRSAGAAGIQVVESRLLSALGLDAAEFREQNLMPLATFQVDRLTIRRGGSEISAERAAGGRWRLTSPVAFPADAPRIESALAACASVRVLDPPRGFVADNVTDFAPYGLDQPAAVITLRSVDRPDSPLSLEVGKAVTDHPDQVYVRRADQDDVAAVSSRFLSVIPDRSAGFRGQNVTDLVPDAVTDIEIQAPGTTYRLRRSRDSWELLSPTAEKADRASVTSLLRRLDALQTSEFLEPDRVPRPELDPPRMTVKVWQGRGNGASPGTPATAGQDQRPDTPALNLRIGRHDVLKKTVFGQIEGDDVILALPDTILEDLPRNPYAYRDRRVLAVSPERVERLTLDRGGTVLVLEPDQSSSAPNRWKMTRPVAATADVRAVTQLIALLADLRAEDFVGEVRAEAAQHGLDRPLLSLSWTETAQDAAGPRRVDVKGGRAEGSAGNSLKVGNPVPGKPGSFYAAVDGHPMVLILGPSVLQALTAEFHDTRVLTFPPDSVRRLVFRTRDRTSSFIRRREPRGDPSDWSPEPGTDPRGIDLSRFNDLIKQLAELRTVRFAQYQGPMPSASGLDHPRLVLEVHSTDQRPIGQLRIGAVVGDLVLAATGSEPTGPVFTLPAMAWEALIQSLGARDALPDDVFTP